MILTDGIAMPDVPKYAPNFDTLKAGAPPIRLIDPQRVYSESLRDAAKKAVLNKNAYGAANHDLH